MTETVILRGLMGSHSCGTATPQSDRDLMEVVLGDEDSYLGLDWWGDQGTKEQRVLREDGSIDHETTSYELKKFLRLCQGFNPNVIPLLWLEPKFYEIVSPAGQLLLDNRHLFTSKQAIHSFFGYAYAQLKKMGDPTASTGRMGAKRKELRDNFGYDTKYAYHTVRLARMLNELLASGKLKVWRGGGPSAGAWDQEELLAIRNGEWSYERVVTEVETLLAAARNAEHGTFLPEVPAKHEIRQLCKRILREHLSLG